MSAGFFGHVSIVFFCLARDRYGIGDVGGASGENGAIVGLDPREYLRRFSILIEGYHEFDCVHRRLGVDCDVALGILN